MVWNVKFKEFFFFKSKKNSWIHQILIRNLTKFGFGHVKTFLRSFWAISIDMKNGIFLSLIMLPTEYFSCLKISMWKFFSESLDHELHFSEITCVENNIQNPMSFTTSKEVPPGFTNKTIAICECHLCVRICMIIALAVLKWFFHAW